MTSLFSTDKIEVICIADTINLQDVKNQFAKSFVAIQYRDALHIDVPRGHIFVFNYGVIVTWGISDAKKTLIMEGLERFHSKNKNNDWETYTFIIEAQGGYAFSKDTVTLQNAKTHTLLAISHAYAQSRKLEIFESNTQKLINDNRYLSSELIDKGHMSLSRKELAKLRGALFQTKSDIVSRFGLLDIPAYFADHVETQELYTVASGYLQIGQRMALLRMNLQTMHDLLNVLATEQNHKHWSFLERTLIILIALGIALLFVH